MAKLKKLNLNAAAGVMQRFNQNFERLWQERKQADFAETSGPDFGQWSAIDLEHELQNYRDFLAQTDCLSSITDEGRDRQY